MSIFFDRIKLATQYFLVQAGLQEEIDKLELSPEISEFVLTINDPAVKGQVLNFLKKNKGVALGDLKAFIDNLGQKQQAKKQLQTSDIPPDILNLLNQIQSEKLKIYIRKLFRKQQVPEKINLDDLKSIEHFISENADINIIDISYKDLLDLTKNWEESFTKNTSNAYEKIDTVYGPKWKNENFNGHVVVEITTHHDLQLEGGLLRHCVGGYYDKIRNKTAKIFSLRNPSGQPLVTMETSPDLFSFKQTFGYQNSQPNQLQMSMINEWKQSVHPKEKVLGLARSTDSNNKIKAAQFMDYNDPDYSQIIDELIFNENDSGKEFLGIQTENEAKDVLQALASNETLSPECYAKIYTKCSGNKSTLFSLIRNPKIPDALFKLIYEKHKKEYLILSIICSSFSVGKQSNYEILQEIMSNNLYNPEYIRLLLNNPSIKSNTTITLINNLDKETIKSVIDNYYISNFEPKFIDDLLNSNNQFIKNSDLINILIKNNNIDQNKDILKKFYSRFGIESNRLLVSKQKLFTNLINIDPIYFYKYLNLRQPLTDEQLLYLLRTYSPSKINLLRNKFLNSKQFAYLFNIVVKSNNRSDLVELAQSPKLTKNQVNYLLNKGDSDINFHLLQTNKIKKSDKNDKKYEPTTDLQLKTMLEYDFDKLSIAHLTDNQINYLLNERPDINRIIARNNNLKDAHIEFLLKSNDSYVIEGLAQNDAIKTNHIDVIINKKNDILNYTLSHKKNLSKKQISDILNTSSNHFINTVANRLAKNYNFTTDQINIVLAKGDHVVSFIENIRDQLTPDQISMLLQNNKVNEAFLTANLTQEQVALFFDAVFSESKDYKLEQLCRKQPLTDKQMQLALSLNKNNLYKNLAANENLTKEQAKLFLNINNENVDYSLASNSNLDTEIISYLLNKYKNNFDILYPLSKAKKLTNEQVKILLSKSNNDIDYNLCFNNLYLGANYLSKNDIDIIIPRGNDEANGILAEDPNLTIEQCFKLLDYNPAALNKLLGGDKYSELLSSANAFQFAAYKIGIRSS